MATAKAILNTKYQSKDQTYQIVIRLINRTKQKNYPTGEKVRKELWEDGKVSKKHPEAKRINSVIDFELSKAKTYFADCRINNIPIDLDLVFSEVKSHSLTEYLKKRAEQYRGKKQIIMWRKANRFRVELLDCFGRELYCNELNRDLLTQYETYLINLPNSDNTRAKKFDFLGRWYGELMVQEKAKSPNPFKMYHIPTKPTKKEKLTLKEFRDLEDLPLKPGALKMARDMFLFSYYTKGSRFETCLTMPKSAIHGGRLHFKTNKGEKHLSVRIHPKLQNIIDSYIDNDGDYILPLYKKEMPRNTPSEEEAYIDFIGSVNATINRNLKTVAELAGVKKVLSQHIARHSLAFHLKKSTNNINVIKDVLGHSDSRITETYLTELDDEFLDSHMDDLYISKGEATSPA